MPLNHRRAHRRASLVLALLAALALVGLHPAGAGAAASAPTGVTVTGISSAVQAPAGTRPGAVPTVLVKGGVPADGDFTQYDVRIGIHLTGATVPAAFTKDTALALSATSASGAAVTLIHVDSVVPKGQTDWTLTAAVSAPVNQVTIAVNLPGRKVAPGSGGTTPQFDALVALTRTPSTLGSPFSQGIGGTGACADTTPSAPVCGVANLPLGAFSDVFLSQGVCDAAYAHCRAASSVVQLLADLDGAQPLYSPASPFTVVMRCDKALCGGGAIKSTVVNVALDGNAELLPIPACPAKGIVGADQTRGCVDLVQSTRDNAGDTFLFVLLPNDARVSIG